MLVKYEKHAAGGLLFHFNIGPLKYKVLCKNKREFLRQFGLKARKVKFHKIKTDRIVFMWSAVLVIK